MHLLREDRPAPLPVPVGAQALRRMPPHVRHRAHAGEHAGPPPQVAEEEGAMPRYFCTAATGIRATDIIGQVLDRAPRPYSASEIAEITGLPINVVTSFLTRNQARGRISVRIVPV